MFSKFIVEINISKTNIRHFGIIIGLIFFTISSIYLWKYNTFNIYYIILGILIILIGYISPNILKPIYYIWMLLGNIMGWLITNILLCILYYIVIGSIALILRICGKKLLELNWDKSKESYWNYKSSVSIDKDTYEKQF